MTCPVTVRLGVYALGAADPAERVLVESHLASCRACRAELERLEPMAGLLACVPVDLIRGDRPLAGPPAPAARATLAGRARAAAERRRSVAGVAAAVAALGAATGFWLAQPGARQPAPSSPPAAITLSGANPATHVRVTVTLTGTSWGTSIRMLASGLPLNQPCRLIAHSRSGGTEITGAWDAWRTGPVSIPASAGWRLTDIASLQVATANRTLVTVTASGRRGGRPASRG